MAKNIMVVGTVAAALAAAPMVAPASAHADTPAASGDAKPQGDAASPLPPSLADTLAPVVPGTSNVPDAPDAPAKPESADPDAAAPQDGAAMPSDDAEATAPDAEAGEDAPAAQTPPHAAG